MPLRRRALIWALGLMLCAVSAEAARAQEVRLPIYADGLAPGWNNWSWAKVTLGVAATDNERPIMVEAGPWQALYLQHENVDTHGYTKFTFWVSGGEHGGQTLSVFALVNGQVTGANAYVRVTPPTNTWTKIEVPLSAIDAVDKQVNGFWIQNGSADTAPRFFVNYIALE